MEPTDNSVILSETEHRAFSQALAVADRDATNEIWREPADDGEASADGDSTSGDAVPDGIVETLIEQAENLAALHRIVRGNGASSWRGVLWTPTAEGGALSWEPGAGALLRVMLDATRRHLDRMYPDAPGGATMDRVIARILQKLTAARVG